MGASHESDGGPYVKCRTQRDVVGSKTVHMEVALLCAADALKSTLSIDQQLSASTLSAEWSLALSLGRASILCQARPTVRPLSTRCAMLA